MKIDMLGIAEAMNDVQSSYETLDAQLRQSEEIAEMMMSIESLYNDVMTLGYCDIVKDRIQNCYALKELSTLSVEKIIQYKATEGIGEAVKEGAKKFWEAIKTLFQKFMEFFGKLFNTFDNKCREILLHLNSIDFEKEVSTLTKEKYANLLAAGLDVKEFMEKAFSRVGNQIRYTKNAEIHMANLASSHRGVLTSSEFNGLALDPKAVEFENKTLKESGYSLGDIRNFIGAFQTKTKSYSQLGAFFVSVVKFYEAEDTTGTMYGTSYADRHSIRVSIRAQGFLYRLLAKIQAVTCKQIIAFYKCIGDVVSINPNAPTQIGYAG